MVDCHSRWCSRDSPEHGRRGQNIIRPSRRGHTREHVPPLKEENLGSDPRSRSSSSWTSCVRDQPTLTPESIKRLEDLRVDLELFTARLQRKLVEGEMTVNIPEGATPPE